MNIDDYQTRYEEVYAAFAKAVRRHLREALAAADEGVPQPQATQSRAKAADSLRPKLQDRGILDSDAIETHIKDLAGVRIIFYTDADIDRFIASRIIPETFDVEWRETKLHHPNPDNDGRLYQAMHYVVRLKPDTLAKPEYACFEGMRCEIQIQTMLSHIWAEISHNIIYKKPELKGFGSDAFQAIERRLHNIMREYLIPAGHEFSKVQHDFDRVMQGRALFDRGILETLAASRDNNERYDTLSTIREYVVPNYDDISAVFPELVRALCAAVQAARRTEPKSIPSELGDLPGATAQQIATHAVEILKRLRYVNVETTFHALVELFRDETDADVRKDVLNAVEELARHNLEVWRQVGPAVQFLLTGIAEQISADDLPALKPIIRLVWCAALKSDLRGTSEGATTFTISIGAVLVSDELRTARQKAIDGLIALFDQAASLGEKMGIFADLMEATSTPTQGQVSHDLYALTIEDTARIAGLLEERVAGQPYELLQHIQHRMLMLFRRTREIASDAEDRFGCKDAADRLLTAIELLRDRIDADPAFVRYQALVGFQGVYPPHWEDDAFDFEAAEAYRRDRLPAYIAEITAEDEPEWFDLITRCAATKSNDGATFPVFCEFLRGLAQEKPSVVLGWLERATEPLLRFLPAILNGLSASTATETYAGLIDRLLDDGQHLASVARHFRFLEAPSVERAETLIAKAILSDDRDTCRQCIALAVESFPSPGLTEAVCCPALRHLAAKGDYSWIDQVWFMRSLDAFVVSLPPEQVRLALDSLMLAPKIDHEIERFLAIVAAHHLPEVWGFLGRRLAGGQGITHYEATPYQFHDLVRPLSADAGLAIETVRAWYHPDDMLFQYTGGRLLCAALPTFSDAVAAKFISLAETGSDQDISFIFDTLPNYRGNFATLPVLMAVVDRLPPGDARLGRVELCIETTGVVGGPFGFVDAFRTKKAALQPWIDDPRPNVRAFVTESIRRLDLRIASEQRSAEQRQEQRRLDFDEEESPEDDD